MYFDRLTEKTGKKIKWQNKFADSETRKQISANTALAIDEIIKSLIKVNWQNEVDVPKKMIHLIGDYMIDEVRDKYNLEISFEEIDKLAESCVNVAKIRYKKWWKQYNLVANK